MPMNVMEGKPESSKPSKRIELRRDVEFHRRYVTPAALQKELIYILLRLKIS